MLNSKVMQLVGIFGILCIFFQFVHVVKIDSRNCAKLKHKFFDLKFQNWIFNLCLHNSKHKSKKLNANLRSARKNKLKQRSYIEKVYDRLPKDCLEARVKSGIYTIEIPYSDFGPFEVFCDAKGGKGITFLRRLLIGKRLNFNRPWSEYKSGFGDLNGEFFLGLDKLHLLTTESQYKFYIIKEFGDDEMDYDLYNTFIVDNETNSYKATLKEFRGDKNNWYSKIDNQKFTTYDRDNDKSKINMASKYKGGWWYDGEKSNDEKSATSMKTEEWKIDSLELMLVLKKY